ncbi:MarR family winged helix-turn-helix transcriptional regulator [Krasilnikoviella flava]|uniref:MarR family winged helix-turn-helix transcriptional regulator n=1 Tax=Krasilnikoviella flava TaxID=526729 RepID=UPI0015921AF0|nr:MarR family transcriptional regulator [Krasilnikoviella flava]
MTSILVAVDYIERVRAQWAERLPDIDTSPAEVGARVRRIAALLEAELADDLAAEEVTRAELDVLTALRRSGRPLRAGEVTTMTGSPGASITKRLDRLERAGLVERAVHERDKRGVLVALTARGESLVDELFPRQIEHERSALTDLSVTERAELGRLLAVVLRRLDPRDY